MRHLPFLHQKYLWKPISSLQPTVFILVQIFLITPWTTTKASNWSQPWPWILPLFQAIFHSAAQVMFRKSDFIVFLFYWKLLVDFSRLAHQAPIPFAACETIHNLVPKDVSSPVSPHFPSIPTPTTALTLKANCPLTYLPCERAVKIEWDNGLPLCIPWLMHTRRCFLRLLCPKARCSYLF